MPLATATDVVPLNTALSSKLASFSIVIAILPAKPVTVFPNASRTVTTMAGVIGEVVVPLPGCVVNTSAAAAAGVKLAAHAWTEAGAHNAAAAGVDSIEHGLHLTDADLTLMKQNGVALVGCPPDLTVWVDEEALAQILDNLVDNAIKYTPNNGRVTVRWEATTQQVCLEVEDTGIGIPERDQPRVFERFYRVDKARSREMGGTGLGLAIVKHLIQAMGGTVRLASTVGQGTTFRIGLPRRATS